MNYSNIQFIFQTFIIAEMNIPQTSQIQSLQNQIHQTSSHNECLPHPLVIHTRNLRLICCFFCISLG